MLSEDQIDVLKSIVDENEELIIDLAREKNISKPDDSVRIARFLVADANNFSLMSAKQKYHYENAIKPLIKEVPCKGMNGDYDLCMGNGFIDEDSLLWAYRDQNMRCQYCIGEKNRWYANNP